jgi:hypothetical protein
MEIIVVLHVLQDTVGRCLILIHALHAVNPDSFNHMIITLIVIHALQDVLHVIDQDALVARMEHIYSIKTVSLNVEKDTMKILTIILALIVLAIAVLVMMHLSAISVE